MSRHDKGNIFSKGSYHLRKLLKSKGKFFLLVCFILLFFVMNKWHLNISEAVKQSFFHGINFSKKTIIAPEKIKIYIKDDNYRKLVSKREEALARKHLYRTSDDFVPALIMHNDKVYNTRIRLKGDHVDHYKGNKWSLRVVVKGDSFIFGMKEFSLQDPMVRRGIYEWIYHEVLRREGIVSLRYKFVNVSINDKELGIFGLEEHFTKQLIESNKRKEGPVIKFNEDYMWHELWRSRKFLLNYGFDKHELPRMFDGSGSYYSSSIDAFSADKTLSEPLLFVEYVKAASLLESFRRGNLKTSQVFDVEKLASYFALSDLLGAQHALPWHNARFYYNPITSRLEPIGFDADCGAHVQALSMAKGHDGRTHVSDYLCTVFSDLDFFKEYVRILERISEKSYLETLFKNIERQLSKNLSSIYSEFPGYKFSKSVFYRNQEFIKAMLNPHKGLHAYFKGGSKEEIKISLANVQSFPIEVVGLSFDGSLLCSLKKPIILAPIKPAMPIEFIETAFKLPIDSNSKGYSFPDLKIEYKLLGSNQLRHEEIFPYPYLSRDVMDKDIMRQEANAITFKFILHDKTNNIFFVKPGSWTIDRNIIFPKGSTVICEKETELDLINSSMIISFSPVKFIGSESSVIHIYSSDSTGLGIAIINCKRESVLRHVVFENLSEPNYGDWGLSGAVTFYESPLYLENCLFKDNNAEDALNIIRSDFMIFSSVF